MGTMLDGIFCRMHADILLGMCVYTEGRKNKMTTTGIYVFLK